MDIRVGFGWDGLGCGIHVGLCCFVGYVGYRVAVGRCYDFRVGYLCEGIWCRCIVVWVVDFFVVSEGCIGASLVVVDCDSDFHVV